MNKNGRFFFFVVFMNLVLIVFLIFCGVSFFYLGLFEFVVGFFEGDLLMDIIWFLIWLGVRVVCGFLGDGGGECCDEEGLLLFLVVEYDFDVVLEVRVGFWDGGRWVWFDMVCNGRLRGWWDGDFWEVVVIVGRV